MPLRAVQLEPADHHASGVLHVVDTELQIDRTPGKSALDAVAYFMGHGLTNVRCLRGGIDAWAQEIDAGMKRYRLG